MDPFGDFARNPFRAHPATGLWRQPAPIVDEETRDAVIHQYLDFVQATQAQFDFIIRHMLAPPPPNGAGAAGRGEYPESSAAAPPSSFSQPIEQRVFSNVRFYQSPLTGERTAHVAGTGSGFGSGAARVDPGFGSGTARVDLGFGSGTARVNIDTALPRLGHGLESLMTVLGWGGSSLGATSPARPTHGTPPEVIERATELVPYEPQTQEVCPIGYTRFEEGREVMRIRHCGHIFEPQNLRTWFNVRGVCPVCRYDINTYRGDEDLDAPVATPATPHSDDDAGEGAPADPHMSEEEVLDMALDEHMREREA